MIYRKKPVEIQALEFKGNISEILEFMGIYEEVERAGKTIEIPTPEGVMTAQIGDYIIKGIKGEFYPCKPDIFEATYEKVDMLGD